MAYKKIEPEWVCLPCASKKGAAIPDGHVYTMHTDVCGICGKTVPVTEPRDFGRTRHLLKVVPLAIRLRWNAHKRRHYAKTYVSQRKPKPKGYMERYDKARAESASRRKRLRRIDKKQTNG